MYIYIFIQVECHHSSYDDGCRIHLLYAVYYIYAYCINDDLMFDIQLRLVMLSFLSNGWTLSAMQRLQEPCKVCLLLVWQSSRAVPLVGMGGRMV